MAKKRASKKSSSSGSDSVWKNTFNTVVEKSMQSVLSVVAQNSAHIIDWIKRLPNLKRKLQHIVTAVALSLAGVIVFATGLATYLATVFPNLGNGLSHIVVGAILLVIAMLYVRLD